MLWEITRAPGWSTRYRVVPLVTLIPRRIDGRWRWLVPHFALQGEPGWTTIERAMTPDRLLGVLHILRSQAVAAYNNPRQRRSPHAVTEKSSYL